MKESSGFTYQVVSTWPFAIPSKSSSLPSITTQGLCPPPVLGFPSLCKIKNSTASPTLKLVAVMVAVSVGL